MDCDINMATHRKLTKYVRNKFRCDDADAQDSASHAIVVAIETGNRDIYYLAKCAYFHFMAERKKHRTSKTTTLDSDPDAVPPPQTTTPATQEMYIAAMKTMAAIGKLPPKRRELMGLMAQGYSLTEAADALGVGKGTVGESYELAIKALESHRELEPPRDFYGVQKHHRRFSARIRVNGKMVHLGMFGTDIDAAKAYDVAAMRWNGPKAKLNFAPVDALAIMECD